MNGFLDYISFWAKSNTAWKTERWDSWDQGSGERLQSIRLRNDKGLKPAVSEGVAQETHTEASNRRTDLQGI